MNPTRRTLLHRVAAASAAGLGGCAVAPSLHAAPAWAPDADTLAALPALLLQHQVPGLALAGLENGSLVWAHHAGLAHAGTAQAVQADSLFEAASLSKPVFAWLVLRLVDAGQLDLDTRLTALLRPTDLADDPRVERITVRDVLRHSTGLPNWRKAPLREALQPAVEPGQTTHYSGEAFFWLQRALEARTGRSLDELASRHLFRPAGMQDSSFTWNAALAARSVHGHGHVPGHGGRWLPLPPQGFRERWNLALPLAQAWDRPLRHWGWTEAERAFAALGAQVPSAAVAWPGDLMANAAASLRCTAADYARFLRVLMPEQLTRRERVALTLRPATHAAFIGEAFRPNALGDGKTLGWNLEWHAGRRVLVHSGNNANLFRTLALAEPAQGRALVVLTNGRGGAALAQALARRLTGLNLRAWAPGPAPSSPA